jgi:dipeptidyl aminopeptidase/acylaminoacyl peptidase
LDAALGNDGLYLDGSAIKIKVGKMVTLGLRKTGTVTGYHQLFDGEPNMNRLAGSCVFFFLAGAMGLAPEVADAQVRDHGVEPEDYFSIVTVAQCAVSPDGSRIAYTQVSWGEPKEKRAAELWVVDCKTKSRRRLTFDRVGAASPRWSPDGALIYFAAHLSRPGAETPPYDGSTQVWRVSPAGGDPFPVTRIKDGIGLFEISHDGRTLYFTRANKVVDDEWQELQQRYADLEYGHGVTEFSQVWSLDLESWRTNKIIDEKRVIRDMAVSPDERRIAMITTPDEKLLSNEGWSRVDIFDKNAGAISQLTSAEWRKDHPSPFGWLENLAWSADGGALAFSISFDGYPTELYVAEWVDGDVSLHKLDRPASLTVGDSRPQWRGRSRDLCFIGEERARARVYCIEDVRGGRQGRTRTLTPGDVVVTAFDSPVSGAPLAVVMSTTTHMRDLFLFPAGGAPQRITSVNPQVETWKLPQISLVTWKGARGDEVEGILELPPDYQPGDGPLPMIVELHGGPTAATHYQLRFWIYGRTLMPARGYALFSPNYRGSTGYGDEFMTDLVGHENDIEIEDILKGVDAMVERNIADPDRLGVMGWSNGGLLTNCIITHTTRFKAASTGAGVLDMVLQWGTEDTPGHVVNYMQGLPWEKPDAYRKPQPSSLWTR